MNTITVGYIIHNKKDLLPQIFDGLKESFSKEDEFVFLFDNCTDDSLNTAFTESRRVGLDIVALNFDDGDLFEIKATNEVLKWFMGESKNEVIILFQDDIVCHDKNIKNRLDDILSIGNVGLIGGRSGYNLNSIEYPEKPVGKISNWEHKEDQYQVKMGDAKITRATRTFVNRGPIILTKDLINSVGYFDEYYFPQNCDDLDYCMKAREKGRQNYVFRCNVESRIEWGTTRSKDTPLFRLTRGRHVKENWNKFVSRWGHKIIG